jgi:hypothetical protein
MGVVVSGASHTPPPAGTHQAVCVDVVDLGMVEKVYDKKPKKVRVVKLVWQINEANEATGKRFCAYRRYTASLGDKASLRRDLQSWRGRPFTQEELKGFDLDNVLGVNCMLNIVHQPDGQGGAYANVDAIMPLIKGISKITPLDYIREQDRPKDEQHADGREPGSDDDEPDVSGF